MSRAKLAGAALVGLFGWGMWRAHKEDERAERAAGRLSRAGVALDEEVTELTEGRVVRMWHDARGRTHALVKRDDGSTEEVEIEE